MHRGEALDDFDKKDVLKIYFRSLFLEATWNFERIQNIGYAYLMLPVYKKTCSSIAEFQGLLKRSLGFFNTNYYMSGLLVGLLLNMEVKRFKKEGVNEEHIEAVKRNFMGPLAALGDNFFWATLRPLAALLGIAGALIQEQIWPHGLWGVLIFLLVFNIPHLILRFGGLWEGYRKGDAIIEEMQKINFQKVIREVRLLGMIFLGTYLPSWMFVNHQGEFMVMHRHSLLRLGTFLVALVWFRIGLTPTKLFCFLVIACIVATYAGVVPPAH